MKKTLITLLCLTAIGANAQTYNQIDETGQITQRDENENRNFNKHSNDTTKTRRFPRASMCGLLTASLATSRRLSSTQCNTCT